MCVCVCVCGRGLQRTHMDAYLSHAESLVLEVKRSSWVTVDLERDLGSTTGLRGKKVSSKRERLCGEWACYCLGLGVEPADVRCLIKLFLEF